MSHTADSQTKYLQALASLGRALVFGIHPSLEGIKILCERLGNPQRSFVPIQITGTNGKTSTTHMVDAILRSQEQEVGRFTSPELIDYTERITLRGKDISKEKFAELFNRVNALVGDDEITEFEILTAMAFESFQENALDFGVLEVGMGGRWDATSICDPAVSVITGISLDHTRILGSTVSEIAQDKAMIIKPGSTPVLGRGFDEVLPIFLNRAAEFELHPRLIRLSDEETFVPEDLTTRYYIHEQSYDEHCLVKTALTVKTPHAVYDQLEMALPAYQAQNVAIALTAAEAALGRELDIASVRSVLKRIVIPGRFEPITLEPLTIFDGGHNPQAANMLAQTLQALGISPIVAFGAYADKDIDSMLEALCTIADKFIAIEAYGSRATPASEIAQIIEEACGAAPCATVDNPTLEGLRTLAGDQPLLITGSLSLYHLLKS